MNEFSKQMGEIEKWDKACKQAIALGLRPPFSSWPLSPTQLPPQGCSP